MSDLKLRKYPSLYQRSIFNPIPSWHFGDIIFLVLTLNNIKGMILYPIFYLLSIFGSFRTILESGLEEMKKCQFQLCVGNITLGGAGKTPTVIFLARYLNKNNINAHVVSRGYKEILKIPF